MNSNQRFFVLALLMIFLAAANFPVITAPAPWRRYHFKIINEMGPGKAVDVHCKSGDRDLGFQRLPTFNSSYEYGFKINFFGTTLYFCNLWYWNFHVVFDAFTAERIDKCGGGTWCIWKARDDGIYLYDTYKKRDRFRYKWGNK